MTDLNHLSPGQSVEDWRPVPTMPHIEASTLGRLRYIGPPRLRMQPGHIIPQVTNPKGYKQANIPIVGDGPARAKMHKVHRLVALAFHGLPPLSNQRIVVGHLDDDPGNNRPENLKWMTQRENCNAPGCKAKHLRNNRGANNPRFGKKHTPETLAKMSANRRGESNPMFGRQHSLETRAKLRESATRRRPTDG